MESYTEQQVNEWKSKAEKWDALEEEILKCYANDDGSENDDPDIDLGTIGEMAASAFGFL